jgi:hypothetical protein
MKFWKLTWNTRIYKTIWRTATATMWTEGEGAYLPSFVSVFLLSQPADRGWGQNSPLATLSHVLLNKAAGVSLCMQVHDDCWQVDMMCFAARPCTKTISSWQTSVTRTLDSRCYQNRCLYIYFSICIPACLLALKSFNKLSFMIHDAT